MKKLLAMLIASAFVTSAFAAEAASGTVEHVKASKTTAKHHKAKASKVAKHHKAKKAASTVEASAAK